MTAGHATGGHRPEVSKGTTALGQVAGEVRSGRRSAESQVQEALQRLVKPSSGYGPVERVLEVRALRRARALDASASKGRSADMPLLGIPFLVKGNLRVRGEPMTGFGPAYGGWIPDRDARLITDLEERGAVLVGTARFTELALASSEAEIQGPAVTNPHDPARTVGGSSSGCAVAVAEGRVPLAIGTDTGGSVRIPAAFAGAPGLKPTDGLLSRDGVLPVSWSLDQVGLFAASAAAIGEVLSALGLFTTTLSPEIAGQRIGLVYDAWADHPRTEEAASAMLERASALVEDLGAGIIHVSLPELASCQPTLSAIIDYEAARSHGPALSIRSDTFGPFIRERLSRGQKLTTEEYLRRLGERDRYRGLLQDLFQSVDVLLLPTIPFVPPTVAEVHKHGSTDHARLTRLFNLAGLPALSVPGAWSPQGLPLGLQVVADAGNDALAIAVGAALEVLARKPSVTVLKEA